jgi:hypothetical protein
MQHEYYSAKKEIERDDERKIVPVYVVKNNFEVSCKQRLIH